MGGKGRRRRERNYRAAHGGGSKSLLPPPPDPSKLDSLPSKLRTLISLSSSQPGHTLKACGEDRRATTTKSKPGKRDARGQRVPSLTAPPPRDSPVDSVADHEDPEKKKKKKKRKRGEPVDLRFQSSDYLSEGSSSQRKERKKAYKESKKKKKQKKLGDQSDGDFSFPGHEKVEFGDVVDQPPRLASIPKAMKFFENASKQRLRLQAIEAYRNRKGWSSRPGINLAPAAVSHLS
ncbi:hypothetical protein MLD38_005074 [Melastoma candidum]|uniref:Uncharacterized protein n=1 Tax=Melastoma candidum TaxID=119954 RepID=A0ACB9SBM0_9MYRT|nr:hypothetical protein MLD38_005074 [Melastoma candidum]